MNIIISVLGKGVIEWFCDTLALFWFSDLFEMR